MYLVNCRLLPELSGGVSAERGCVEIEDGLIAAVLPEAPEDAAEAFDCEGGTLLPGLIDLHTHITLLDGVALKCAADPMQVMVEAAAQAKRYLARGFTTIRDCGSVGRSANYVKRMIDAGIFQGPDILACGCILSPSVDGPRPISAPPTTTATARRPSGSASGARSRIGRTSSRFTPPAPPSLPWACRSTPS